jgi:uncharacterized protein (DUF952 family)
MSTIYKICAAAHWQAAQHDGIFSGSADDLRDGYIHFSTAEQVAETARRYFHGRGDLVLLHVAAESLGADLKWEPSRGGALFPHLYASLRLDAVLHVEPLTLDASGTPIIPALPK